MYLFQMINCLMNVMEWGEAVKWSDVFMSECVCFVFWYVFFFSRGMPNEGIVVPGPAYKGSLGSSLPLELSLILMLPKVSLASYTKLAKPLWIWFSNLQKKINFFADDYISVILHYSAMYRTLMHTDTFFCIVLIIQFFKSCWQVFSYMLALLCEILAPAV